MSPIEQGGGGGGGGSQPVSDAASGAVIAALNTFVYPWNADSPYAGEYTILGNSSYPNSVTSVDGTHTFKARFTTGTTGETEPDWAGVDTEDGLFYIFDGDMIWSVAPYLDNGWQPNLPVAAGTQLTFGDRIFQVIYGAGVTGSEEPDFGSTAVGANVSDNDITWSNIGPSLPWQPNLFIPTEVYPDHINVGEPTVIPTTPQGLCGLWGQGPLVARSGDTEPAWDATTGHLTLDHGVVWEAA